MLVHAHILKCQQPCLAAFVHPLMLGQEFKNNYLHGMCKGKNVGAELEFQ